MCVLMFDTHLSKTVLILRRTERDMIKNVYRSSCKVPASLVLFQRNLKLKTNFQNVLQYQIS